jgi:hypothetical protein
MKFLLLTLLIAFSFSSQAESVNSVRCETLNVLFGSPFVTILPFGADVQATSSRIIYAQDNGVVFSVVIESKDEKLKISHIETHLDPEQEIVMESTDGLNLNNGNFMITSCALTKL